MALELTSLVILGIAAGLGLLGGYWTRIAKKLEDKRDDIYLTTLPKIYADVIAFQDVLTLFSKGETLENLKKSLDSAITELNKTIYSGNILIFKTELHDSLIVFHKDLKKFGAVVRRILDQNDNNVKKQQTNAFRSALENKKIFPIGQNLIINPSDVSTKADNIRKDVEKELDKYRSFSWKLMVLLFVLGIFIGLVDLLKEQLSP